MKKILVIDDDDLVRSVLIAFLEAAEFEVLQAEDGLAGVEMAKEHIPDLIVCDVNMPRMDGYGVLKELREFPSTLAIPFVFLSGRDEREDLRAGMDLGADDYLTKPFKRTDLLRAIDARLAKKAALAWHFTSELHHAEEQLNYVLHYDGLTGLPNRLTLRERLNQILVQTSSKQQVGILSFGLDRFKRINDTMGYTAGDLLLKTVSERIMKCVSPNDTVARLGADQFAIILSGVTHKESVEKLAHAILETLAAPFNVNGTNIFSTASIGITLYPVDGVEIDDLIKNAETAMHSAKESGGNTCLFYKPEIHALSASELGLEANLRYALERKQLSLNYQPQISLQTGAITGAEALVRWHHPEKGLIPPSQFVPIAEKSGMIVQISEWVLRTACSQAKKWQQLGHRSFMIAVNLTGLHFSQKNLGDRLIDILRETGLEPSSLDIELTESILMKDAPTAISMLNELKGLGIQISIDDFGTGYSSLSYLKRFPFDILKIDQSFIRNCPVDLKNAAITTAIIEIAHNLDLQVIAEGVEHQNELAFLSKNRCDGIQGYLFSRPIPADDFESLLSSGKSLSLPLS